LRQQDASLRLVEECQADVGLVRTGRAHHGLSLVHQSCGHECLGSDRDGIPVRRKAGDVLCDLAGDLDRLRDALRCKAQSYLRCGVVDDVLPFGTLRQGWDPRRGVAEAPELEQDFGELEAPPPAHLFADGGRRGQLDALDGLECSDEIASRSEAPAPCDLEHVGDDIRPGFGRDLDHPVVDTRRHRVQARPGVVVRDVVRDEGVAAAARLVEGLVEHLPALGGAADVEQRKGHP